MDGTPQITGLGEIAERLDVPIHRVVYIIRSRRIQPLMIVGGRNLYSEAAVSRITHELTLMEQQRGTAKVQASVDTGELAGSLVNLTT